MYRFSKFKPLLSTDKESNLRYWEVKELTCSLVWWSREYRNIGPLTPEIKCKFPLELFERCLNANAVWLTCAQQTKAIVRMKDGAWGLGSRDSVFNFNSALPLTRFGLLGRFLRCSKP